MAWEWIPPEWQQAQPPPLADEENPFLTQAPPQELEPPPWEQQAAPLQIAPPPFWEQQQNLQLQTGLGPVVLPTPAPPPQAPPGTLERILADQAELAQQEQDATQELVDTRAEGLRKTAEATQQLAQTKRNDAVEQAKRLKQVELTSKTELDRASELRRRTYENEIDPKRYWKNLSGFQKGAAIVGAFIGGLLEPYRGKNTFLELLNQEVDRDTEAQKANLQKAMQLADMDQQSALQNYQARRQAITDYMAARQNHWDSLMDEMKSQIMLASSEEEKKKATLGFVEIQKKSVEEELKTRQVFSANEMAKLELEDKFRNSAASRAATYESIRASKDARENAPKVAAAAFAKDVSEKGVRDPRSPGGYLADKDGNPIIAPTEKEAIELRTMKGTAGSMADGLERLAEIYGSVGWASEKLGDDAAMEAQTIIEDLKTDYAVLKGQGAISEGDRKSYDSIFGSDPTSWRDFRPKWKALINNLERKVNRRIENTTGQRANWKHESISVVSFDPNGESTQHAQSWAKEGTGPDVLTVSEK